MQTETPPPKDQNGHTISTIYPNSLYDYSNVSGLPLEDSEEIKSSFEDTSKWKDYEWKNKQKKLEKGINAKKELFTSYYDKSLFEIMAIRDELIEHVKNQANRKRQEFESYFTQLKAQEDASRQKEQEKIDYWAGLIQDKLARYTEDSSKIEHRPVLSGLITSEELSKELSMLEKWCAQQKEETRILQEKIQEHWKTFRQFDFNNLTKLYETAFEKRESQKSKAGHSLYDSQSEHNNSISQIQETTLPVASPGGWKTTSEKGYKEKNSDKSMSKLVSGNVFDPIQVPEEAHEQQEEDDKNLGENNIPVAEQILKEDDTFLQSFENRIVAGLDDSNMNTTVIEKDLDDPELRPKVELLQNSITELDIEVEILKGSGIRLHTVGSINDKTIPKMKKLLVDVLNQNPPLPDMLTEIKFIIEDVDEKAMKNFSKVLQNFGSLSKLNLSFQKSDRLAPDWSRSLGESLKKLSNLKELRLTLAKWNNLNVSSMTILAHALLEPTNLSILRLDFSECPDADNACIKELFRMISKHKNLTRLTLIFKSCPKIDDKHMDIIGDFYSKMDQLEKLKFDFRNCPNFSHKAKDKLKKYSDTMGNLENIQILSA